MGGILIAAWLLVVVIRGESPSPTPWWRRRRASDERCVDLVVTKPSDVGQARFIVANSDGRVLSSGDVENRTVCVVGISCHTFAVSGNSPETRWTLGDVLIGGVPDDGQSFATAEDGSVSPVASCGPSHARLSDTGRLLADSSQSHSHTQMISTFADLSLAIQQAQGEEEETTIHVQGYIIFETYISIVNQSVAIFGSETKVTVLTGAHRTQLFRLSRGGFSVTNVTFRYGANNSLYGGLLFGTDSRINLFSCVVDSFHSRYQGGAFYVINTNFTATFSNFTNNTAEHSGGAVYPHRFCWVDLISCNFISNSAGEGGVMIIGQSGPVLNVVDCVFDSNRAEVNGGGALRVVFFAHGNIVNSTFISNHGKAGGGAADVFKSTASVVGCTFKTNGGKEGGAFRVKRGAKLDVASSIFDSNYAIENAGVSAVDQSNVSIVNSYLINNTAGSEGGAFYAIRWPANFADVALLNLSRSTFIANRAKKSAGVARLSGASALYTVDCQFSNNSAGFDGGIIQTYLSTVHIVNCVFENNLAGDRGGILFLIESMLSIEDSTFKSNAANRSSGVVFMQETAGRATNCVFSENAAFDNTGVISVLVKSYFLIENSLFNSNSAVYSGVIRVSDGTLDVANSTFISNTVRDDAAVFYVPQSSNLTVSKSMFKWNHAGRHSGVFYTRHAGSTLKVTECVFDTNSAGNRGGVAFLLDSTGTSDFSENYFASNWAERGGAIFVGQAAFLQMKNSTLSPNDNGANFLECQSSGTVYIAFSTLDSSHRFESAQTCVIYFYLANDDGSASFAENVLDGIMNGDGATVLRPWTYPCSPGMFSLDGLEHGNTTEYADKHGKTIDENDPECDAGCDEDFTCTRCLKSCTTCPSGRYSPYSLNRFSLIGESSCMECPVGRYLFDNGTNPELHDEAKDCSACPPGTYVDDVGASNCKNCPIGTFQSEEGQTACVAGSPGHYVQGRRATFEIPCPPGSWSSGAAQTCTLCKSGEFQPEYGASSCLVASPGFFVPGPGESEELACQPGRFSAGFGTTTCTFCEQGTFVGDSNATRCQPASPGFYVSSAGARDQTACPPGRIAPGIGGRSCTKCEAGAYALAPGSARCTLALPGNFVNSSGNNESTPCAPGTFSGVAAAKCIKCPAGTFAANEQATSCDSARPGFFVDSEGAADEVACDPGRISAGSGSTSCSDCLPGSFAPGRGSTSCTTADAGKFVKNVGGTEATPCPPGTFSASGDSKCTRCDKGTFVAMEAATSCISARPGYFVADEGGTREVACPAGKIAPGSGASSCIECSPGTFTKNIGSAVCTLADAGHFVSNSGASEETICEPGRFSGSGASTCVECDPGHLAKDYGSTTCVSSDAGFFVKIFGASEQVACEPGRFSGSGASECTKCSPGSFAGSSGSTTCTLVDAGNFVAVHGAAEQSSCPDGKFSSAGATECTDCPLGTYSTSGSLTCTACPQGRTTHAAGQESCSDCAAGKFKGEGPGGCRDCDVGTYAPTRGASACLIADAGSFVDSKGAYEQIKCPAGRFSGSGARSCSACPTGTFSSFLGATTCTLADAGAFVSDVGGSDQLSCPAGKFSGSGSSDCSKCPRGTFSGNGAITCTACPAGETTDVEGSSACSKCPRGTFKGDGSGRCLECDVGTFAPNFGAAVCQLASAGHFVSRIGSSEEVKCPAGTFSGPGSSECLKCDRGTFSDVGAAVCTACSAGETTDDDGSGECSKCPHGRFKGDGSGRCLECDIGTYAPSRGAAVCQLAAAGHFVSETGAHEESACPAGTFSGSGSSECLKCDKGTFSGVGAAVCTACPAGETTGYEGASRCSKCPSGKFKGDGSGLCLECDIGTFAPSSGSAVCQLATAGYFVPRSGSSEELNCPAGKFSGPGSAECSDCGTGTFSGPAASTCTDCAAGETSGEGSSSCSKCPVGTFKGAGSGGCMSCEPGTVAEQEGLSTCLIAEAGTFVADSGSSKQSNCPAGTFSGSGATRCLKCPAGSFAARTGSTSCNPASDGYFVSVAGSSEENECLEGTFAAGFGSTSCSICAAGTYQDEEAQSTCRLADAGAYVLRRGSSSQRLCPAGRFSGSGAKYCTRCVLGTWSTTGATSCQPADAGSTAPRGGLYVLKVTSTLAFEGLFDKIDEGLLNGAILSVASDDTNGFLNLSAVQLVSSASDDEMRRRGLLSTTECTDSISWRKRGDNEKDCAWVGNKAHLLEQRCRTKNEFGVLAMAACTCTCYRRRRLQSTGSTIVDFVVDARFDSAPAENATEILELARLDFVTGLEAALLDGTLQKEFESTDFVVDVASTLRMGEETVIEVTDIIEGDSTSAQRQCPPGKFSSAGGVSCFDCEPGSYNPNNGSSSCRLAEVGRYVNIPGAIESTPCAKGSFSAGQGSMLCRPCEAGRYADQVESPSCSLASSGFVVPTTGATSEIPCSPGRVSAGPGSSFCANCAPGTFQSLFGQSSCVLASAGYFVERAGQAEQIGCSPGKANPRSGYTSCEECGPGRFQSDANQTECRLAPSGTFVNRTGATLATKCPNNEFSAGDGNTECSSCASGEYSPNPGASCCIPADAGTFIEIGSDSPKQCPPGKYSESGATSCELCEKGSFNSLFGQVACSACPPPLTTLGNGSTYCEACDSSYYWDTLEWIEFNETSVTELDAQQGGERTGLIQATQCNKCCRACKDGMACDHEGVILESIPIKKEYWRATKWSNDVYECDMRGACKGGEDVHDYCSRAYKAKSALCGVCSNGYYRDVNENKCERCDFLSSIGEIIALLVVIGVAALVVGFVVYIFRLDCRRLWQYALYLASSENNAGGNESERAIDFSVREDGERPESGSTRDVEREGSSSDISDTASSGGESESSAETTIEKRDFWESVFVKAKILVAAYQVMGALPWNYPQVNFPEVVESALRRVNVFNLGLFGFASLSCFVELTYYEALVVVGTYPFILVGILCGCHALSLAYRRWRGREPTKDGLEQERLNVTYAVLLLIFVCLPGASYYIFKYFNCVKYSTGRGDEPLKVLTIDADVRCSGRRYELWFWPVLLFIFIWPVGVPACFFIALFRWRKQLNPPLKDTDQDDQEQEEILRRREGEFGLVYARYLVSKQQMKKIAIRDADPSIRWLQFLYEDFEPRCHYFPVFESLRRIFMIGVLGLFYPGSMSQITVGVFGSLVSARVFTYFAPYIRDDDDVVSEAAQTQVAAFFFAMLLLFVSEELEHRESFFSGPVFAICLLLVFAVSFVVAVRFVMVDIFGHDYSRKAQGAVSSGIAKARRSFSSRSSFRFSSAKVDQGNKAASRPFDRYMDGDAPYDVRVLDGDEPYRGPRQPDHSRSGQEEDVKEEDEEHKDNRGH